MPSIAGLQTSSAGLFLRQYQCAEASLIRGRLPYYDTQCSL